MVLDNFTRNMNWAEHIAVKFGRLERTVRCVTWGVMMEFFSGRSTDPGGPHSNIFHEKPKGRKPGQLTARQCDSSQFFSPTTKQHSVPHKLANIEIAESVSSFGHPRQCNPRSYCPNHWRTSTKPEWVVRDYQTSMISILCQTEISCTGRETWYHYFQTWSPNLFPKSAKITTSIALSDLVTLAICLHAVKFLICSTFHSIFLFFRVSN